MRKVWEKGGSLLYFYLKMQQGHAQLADVADELLHFRAQQKAQQDEHHAQEDIFAHAAGGADLEREFVLAGKGMQGDARRGQHVQHHMADAAQADAQQGGLPVRGHQMAARQQQDATHQPNQWVVPRWIWLKVRCGLRERLAMAWSSLSGRMAPRQAATTPSSGRCRARAAPTPAVWWVIHFMGAP